MQPDTARRFETEGHGPSSSYPAANDVPPRIETATLTVHPASPLDADRGVARIDPQDLVRLGVRLNDVVAIAGDRVTFARVLPAHARHCGLGIVLLDAAQRENCGAEVGEAVRISPATASAAESLTLAVAGDGRLGGPALAELIRPRLLDTPVAVGDRLKVRLSSGRTLSVEVTASAPSGPIVPGAATQIICVKPKHEHAAGGPAFEGLFGFEAAIARARAQFEPLLTRAERADGLAIPHAALVVAPAGGGKTAFARALGKHLGVPFIEVQGADLLARAPVDRETALKRAFDQAEAKAPAMVLLDDFDLLASDSALAARIDLFLAELAGRSVGVVCAASRAEFGGLAWRRLPHAIRLPPLSDPARRALIQQALRRTGPDFDLDAAEADTRGLPPGAILALAQAASVGAAARAGEADAVEVSAEDWRRAVSRSGRAPVRAARFDEIAGHEAAKTVLMQHVALPLARGAAPACGALLIGPPGVGKTILAQATIAESGAHLALVEGGDIAAAFAQARAEAPAIVLVEDLEALGEDAAETLRIEISRIGDRPMGVIATAEAVEVIPVALARSSAFPIALSLSPPDAAARLSILRLLAEGLALSPHVALEGLAEATDGFTGGDLSALVGAARRIAAARTGRKDAPLEVEDLDQAFALGVETKAALAGWLE